ncbi:Serine/threonine-protein kinase pkpA [Nosema granulosis]|uniref:Serine/threonine-protein kinase pkpA n=1 Tax=Nosema granulosis TaxID=83296 RepID=A0A9P6KYP1_9MICR|nr:Serine/threonine-protein kinase pkpA [Nosema granulosis]
MNDKDNKDTRRDPFEGKVIDAEDVIAREEAGLPQEIQIDGLSPEEERALKRYKKLTILLGEGAFKKVYKAIDQEEGKEVAWNEVKITENEYYNEEKTTFSKEIALLKRISHPNILKIFDYWFTHENFIFITEMMTGGTLREYIASIGDLNLKLIKKWSRQILEGLQYLHMQDPPIIHRDIKCENIFVNASLGEVKIGDLGIAKERRMKRYTVVGTPQFMAREMFEGEGYNEKVDMYAFGMCLIEMATGMYPYKECNAASEVYKCILQGVPPVALYSIKDPCLKNLILNCLVLEKDRISSTKALSHHFFDLESQCPGDCVPPESMLIKPLTTPANDMEISLISFVGDLITFQLFFMCEAKFIKFCFDVNKDTVEAVAEEMLEEEVVIFKQKDNLKKMLTRGIERALERKNSEHINEIIPEATPHKTIDEHTETNIENGLSEIKLIDKKLECPENIQFPVQTDINSNEDVNVSEDTQQCRTRCLESIEFPIRKYEDDLSVEDFAYDTADITNRSQETATSWIKVLKQNDIFSVLDLRYLVDEDWDRLGLSVFICRAMKNMLYGVDKHPLKEKFLPDNPSLMNYEDATSISEFLRDISELFRKQECVSVWESKLLSQDIRTVGELKSLHQDDWDRLGLSVFSYRAIKNMIFRKGRLIDQK